MLLSLGSALPLSYAPVVLFGIVDKHILAAFIRMVETLDRAYFFSVTKMATRIPATSFTCKERAVMSVFPLLPFHAMS